MSENEDCIFCKVVRGKLPAYIVYKDDFVTAFHDINPQAPVHVLIVPTRHIADLEAAAQEDPELVGRMSQAATRIAGDLHVAKNGYRLVLNNGAGAGQIVPHVHMHMMAGRKFNWPPG